MSTHAALHAPARDGRPTVTSAEPASRLGHLKHAIDHAAHLLPAQGPITVFIHHNTLHAFEDLPFTEAVEKGARVFGCQPYLGEDRYREELGRGRIRFADLLAVLQEDLGEQADASILRLGTRLELRLAMLQYPLRFGPTEELRWFMAETDALRRVRPDASAAARRRLIAETRRWVLRDLRGGNEAERNGHAPPGRGPAGLRKLLERFARTRVEDWDEEAWEAFTLQALWRVCCDGLTGQPRFTLLPSSPVRHRDLLLQVTGTDPDLLVNQMLVPFCAAFLDQGVAHWQLPRRDEGFYQAFCALYRQPLGPPDRWLRGLRRELDRLEDAQVGPLESIRESLALLGVEENEWEAFLSATLLSLPGWGGMVQQLEQRGDRVRHPIPPGSVVEFLAVRLLLDRLAFAWTAREELGFTGPLESLREELRRRVGPPRGPSVEQRAFLVFQMAQVLGWTPEALARLSEPEWGILAGEIESFSGVERRRIFHLAYERRFVVQSLDALALHQPAPPARARRPRFQASFCLDDREESIRRHLEEVAPDVETFGIAGFYGLAMYFKGAADAHFVPLCPIVIRPQHWVTEQVAENLTGAHERRARARSALGRASHRVHAGSRGFALGALLTAGLGVLATAPLVARILFPRLTAKLRGLFGRFVQAPPATRLQVERKEATPGPTNGHLGYAVGEMIDIAERQLRDIGLTSGFARLVFLLGHGSFSLNNPHKSAYDCGACGGTPGAPNGRGLAHMLNDARVREGLARRGLSIPDDTVFVGGFHNTCDDSITLFDLDRVPESHREELAAARRNFETALDRNAHERCRRFMSAPLTLSFAQARQHVEARSEDLAQTRPELGHATNALCLVGRRERTRGLFFDRRAFLTTYDPTQDDADGTILTRLLSAAIPVCAGISLEYYFSRVDSAGWGCGTKLPHNVSALLGVMDGAASDLRTGLPWQMVEIHEPVRLLFVIETTPEVMLKILSRNPGMDRVIRNGWSLLAVQHPHSQAIKVYRDGAFYDYRPEAEQLPRAASSVDWYRGWRDHLEFAEIGG
jgi:uncharacterized protein